MWLVPQYNPCAAPCCVLATSPVALVMTPPVNPFRLLLTGSFKHGRLLRAWHQHGTACCWRALVPSQGLIRDAIITATKAALEHYEALVKCSQHYVVVSCIKGLANAAEHRAVTASTAQAPWPHVQRRSKVDSCASYINCCGVACVMQLMATCWQSWLVW
ncbi:hypothetical protein COO60DRAFT_894493 [Scenedesmus sp. NREL 46B-D3]|nr:hypothetical protein COO60DRAFT_894493 [Scenedesmus sp. NREL 46B-D3]